jgi:hypothetical protein
MSNDFVVIDSNFQFREPTKLTHRGLAEGALLLTISNEIVVRREQYLRNNNRSNNSPQAQQQQADRTWKKKAFDWLGYGSDKTTQTQRNLAEQDQE